MFLTADQRVVRIVITLATETRTDGGFHPEYFWFSIVYRSKEILSKNFPNESK
jgi:hypothetical protein